LLRRADKHANAKGAELLNLDIIDLQASDGAANGAAVKNALGKDGVLFLVGYNTDTGGVLQALATGAARTIVIGGCETSLTNTSDLVIAGLTFAEKDGLIVNFEGHIQRLKAGILTRIPSEWKFLDDLLSSLTGDDSVEFISQLRKTISEQEAVFSSVNLANVAPTGKRLGPQPVG